MPHELTADDVAWAEHLGRKLYDIHARRRDHHLREDAVQVGLLELVKSARRWKAGRGEFRAYAFTCIRWRVRMAVWFPNGQSPMARALARAVSLDSPGPGPNAGGSTLAEDLPASDTDQARQAAVRDLVDLVFRAARPRERRVLERLLAGRAQAGAAEDLNISKQRVGQLLGALVRRLEAAGIAREFAELVDDVRGYRADREDPVDRDRRLTRLAALDAAVLRELRAMVLRAVRGPERRALGFFLRRASRARAARSLGVSEARADDLLAAAVRHVEEAGLGDEYSELVARLGLEEPARVKPDGLQFGEASGGSPQVPAEAATAPENRLKGNRLPAEMI